MTEDNNAAFAKDVRQYILEYIKHSDAKAAALMTGIGLIGAGVWAVADKTLSAATALQSWPVTALASLSLIEVALSLIAGLIFCAQALVPRVPKANASLASFPDISGKSQANYVDDVARLLTSESIAAEYAAHAWTLSRINMEKNRSLKWATLCLVSAAFGSLAVLIVNALTRFVAK